MTELERLLLENERMYKTIQALHEGIKMQKHEWIEKEHRMMFRIKELEEELKQWKKEGEN